MTTICNATKERKFKLLHSRKQRCQFFGERLNGLCVQLFLKLLTTTSKKEEVRLKMKSKA